MFSTTIVGNVDQCRTDCEIFDDTGNAVAVVYEDPQGWHVEVTRKLKDEELSSFNANIEAAKESLSHYVNRMGKNRPREMTAGGLSLWLMQRDDGAALELDLNMQTSDPLGLLQEVSSDVAHRIRSIARKGHTLEAVRELRVATGCSLEQAIRWLRHNC
jgi:hypothetical protein